MLTKNDVINNLTMVIDDLKVDEKSSNLSKFSYKDYIYVKQALEYLKLPHSFATLTAKVDFTNLLTSVSIFIASMEMTSEQKELANRIADLFEQYNKTHLEGTQ